MFTSENNWYKWGYGDNFLKRKDILKPLPFNNFYEKFSGGIESFKRELEKNAASTLDHFQGMRPNIFFSGGLESELVLRSYINIGSNPEIFIVKYENNLNILEVNRAIKICLELNVKYNVVDFNLKKFYENDAESLSEISQIDKPSLLPYLKFVDCANGLIILGINSFRWIRSDSDYTKKSNWILRDVEYDIGFDKYNILFNRSAIYQWFKWSPGVILSFLELLWFKKITNNEIIGKLGLNSTKYIGYKEAYPDLFFRKNDNDFYFINEVILEFEEFLCKKYKSLIFRSFKDRTVNDLIKEIRG